jgi:hypothetical protein
LWFATCGGHLRGIFEAIILFGVFFVLLESQPSHLEGPLVNQLPVSGFSGL